MMTAANRFGLYSAFLACSAIFFRSSFTPMFTVLQAMWICQESFDQQTWQCSGVVGQFPTMWQTGGLPVKAELVKQLAHTPAWWFDSKHRPMRIWGGFPQLLMTKYYEHKANDIISPSSKLLFVNAALLPHWREWSVRSVARWELWQSIIEISNL